MMESMQFFLKYFDQYQYLFSLFYEIDWNTNEISRLIVDLLLKCRYQIQHQNFTIKYVCVRVCVCACVCVCVCADRASRIQ